jgi:hypothetical protein
VHSLVKVILILSRWTVQQLKNPLIILYSISSVFAGSSFSLADMLFGILWGPKVPKTPASQHRANQWLTMCKCVGGQDNVIATASSDQPPEVPGHIPGVMKNDIISTHIYFRFYFTETNYFHESSVELVQKLCLSGLIMWTKCSITFVYYFKHWNKSVEFHYKYDQHHGAYSFLRN